MHPDLTASRALPRRLPGVRSRPRSRVPRTSGSRRMVAAPIPHGGSVRCPLGLLTSRARCRCTTMARLPGGCWRSTWTWPAVTSTTRPPSSPSCSIGCAPAASPTCRRAAAATCSCSSRRRCPGGNCATSSVPCRYGSQSSTRRPCRPSAARSALLALATSPAAGACCQGVPGPGAENPTDMWARSAGIITRQARHRVGLAGLRWRVR